MIMNKKKTLPANTDEVHLSSNVTVAKYREMEIKHDKQGIAAFLGERFRERYLLPVRGDSCNSFVDTEGKSGFAMMAIGCLMIEALESFYQGWSNTRNKKGADIFDGFFARYQEFAPLQGLGAAFYSSIRCGILHQAETTGGWLIRRDQPSMVDINAKVVDANIFIKNLEASLDHFCDELTKTDWNNNTWINFRTKMNAIIQNCQR
jgi:hypothetical protein